MILKKLSSYHLLKANSYTCVQCPSPLQFSIFSFSLVFSTLLDPTLKTIIISRVFSSKRTSAICSLRSPSNYHPFIFLSLKGLLLYSSNYPSQITFQPTFCLFSQEKYKLIPNLLKYICALNPCSFCIKRNRKKKVKHVLVLSVNILNY